MDGFTRAGESAFVPVELECPVRAELKRIEFKCQLSRIDVCFELSRLLRFDDCIAQNRQPFLHDFRDPIANRSRSTIKLGGSSCEEATATKDTGLNIAEPDITQLPKSIQTLRRFESRFDNFVDKNGASGFDRGDLKIFFRPEVSEQTTLAHREFERETPDRQTLKPFGRRDVDRHFENGFAGPLALRLPALCRYGLYCFSELSFGQGVFYIARTFVLRQEPGSTLRNAVRKGGKRSIESTC